MRKVILTLIVFLLGVVTVGYAQQKKTGRQLVQELCRQRRYSFCGDQIPRPRWIRGSTSTTVYDARRIMRTRAAPGLSGGGGIQWFTIKVTGYWASWGWYPTAYRVTHLNNSKRVDVRIVWARNRTNIRYLDQAKIRVRYERGYNPGSNITLTCPPGTRIVAERGGNRLNRLLDIRGTSWAKLARIVMLEGAITRTTTEKLYLSYGSEWGFWGFFPTYAFSYIVGCG